MCFECVHGESRHVPRNQSEYPREARHWPEGKTPPPIWRLGFVASPEGELCVHVRGCVLVGGPGNHPGRLGEVEDQG